MSQVFPFSPFATRYSHYKKATPTIQHWELRDLVHCESSEEVVITEGFGIYKVDFRNQVKSPLYLLDFKPTCFSVHGGILAAGGMGGKLKVVRLEDGRIFYAGNLGTHVINSVLVTQRGNDKLLFIVSNSRLLQGFRLDEDCSSELVLICRYESCTCLNYVALSPDGRLLLTVGDSGEYFIYSVQVNSSPRMLSIFCSIHHFRMRFVLSLRFVFALAPHFVARGVPIVSTLQWQVRTVIVICWKRKRKNLSLDLAVGSRMVLTVPAVV